MFGFGLMLFKLLFGNIAIITIKTLFNFFLNKTTIDKKLLFGCYLIDSKI